MVKLKPAALLIEKFGSLTEVQEKSLQLVDEGKNVIIIAPTGSGKTEAAIMPILQKISRDQNKGITALYITPLKALNRNLLGRLIEWCKLLHVSVAVRHGDTTQYERTLQSKNPPQLMIITPETLQAILPGKRIGKALENVKYVIVDEIHELAGGKRGAQLMLGLERLAEKAGEFQRVGVSATVASPNEIARYLCGLRACDIVDLNYSRNMKFEIKYPKSKLKDGATAEKLSIDNPAMARLREIQKIVKNTKTLIFVNTRSIAEILGSRLMSMDKTIAVHHGSLSKDARITLEDDFKSGKLNALIATSSLELGIDIGDINHVIQYMSPKQVSRLIQRVGRSGHTVKGTPTGTIICSDPDDLLETMAIIDMIKGGILDEQRLCIGALDVMAHQIAGVLMDMESIPSDSLYNLIRRAYPYSLIDPDQYMGVIDFMAEKKLLRKDESDVIHRMVATRFYYYEHLSTIPSIQKYFVKDTASNKTISTLDDNFVMMLEPNDLFITKGIPWRILDIDPDRRQVIVEPTQELSAAVPDWEGEEIPTSFEVSQRVGYLRRMIGTGKLKVPEVDKDIKEFKGKQPDDKRVVIEAWGDVAVVHLHGGLKANRTIAAVIGNRLAKDYGSSVRTLVDAYRIAFIFPRGADPKRVRAHLMSIGDLRGELEEALPKNQIFKYKFIHIGKMFYLFRDTPRISERFIQAFRGTPVFDEVMREILDSYFDLKNSQALLKEIQHRNIDLVVSNVKKFSAIAARALNRYHGSELIAPIEPTSEIVKAFKNKILGKSLMLLCTYCQHDWISFVGTLPKKVKCNVCKSSMVTVCDAVENFKLYKKKRLTKDEKRYKEKFDKIAAIVSSSGKTAIIALSTYGVGPTKASQILNRTYKDDTEFFVALMDAQKTFIKNKRFWSPN